MPDAMVPTTDAIDRVVAMFRSRLEAAFANGQRVRMTSHEGTARRSIPLREFEARPLAAFLACEPDGSFELHVYIEPKTADRQSSGARTEPLVIDVPVEPG